MRAAYARAARATATSARAPELATIGEAPLLLPPVEAAEGAEELGLELEESVCSWPSEPEELLL